LILIKINVKTHTKFEPDGLSCDSWFKSECKDSLLNLLTILYLEFIIPGLNIVEHKSPLTNVSRPC